MSMFIPNIISLHLSTCKANLCFCVLRLRHSAVSNSVTLWTLAIQTTLWTPASSVQGIFQVRIMEWVAISSSMGSSWPRYWTRIFCINRWILYHWTIWETVIANPVYSISMWNELAYTNKKGWVMVESSDKTWSTGEGNGKPLQYSCLENPMNSTKRQKDRTLQDELPRLVGAQYATRKIIPERMKRRSPSENNTQLWIWLVMGVSLKL